MSAPMFELQLKNRELQKHLFDFIGAGTITPDFLTKKKFEDENKSLNLEYFAMENLYKKKENFTASAFFQPEINAVAIVMPDLEKPGIMANA